MQVHSCLEEFVFQTLEEYCMLNFHAVWYCGQSDINLCPCVGDMCSHRWCQYSEWAKACNTSNSGAILYTMPEALNQMHKWSPFVKETQKNMGTWELVNHSFYKCFQFILFIQWRIRFLNTGMGYAIYKERLKYTYHCYKIPWEDIRSLRHRWRITLYL